MIKQLLILVLVGCCPCFTLGQGDTEAFAGYSVLRTKYDADPLIPSIPVFVAFDGEQTMHGLNVSVTRYVKGGLGITGDFSWHLKKLTDPDPLGGTIDTKIQVFNLLGGPQYKFFRRGRVSPFVHALAGVAHTRSKLTVASLGTSDITSSTDFAIALGGGLDINVNRRLAVRAVQADYNPVFLRDGNNLGFNKRADNFRLSFGVVFR